jgi:hypothetical protein
MAARSQASTVDARHAKAAEWANEVEAGVEDAGG